MMAEGQATDPVSRQGAVNAGPPCGPRVSAHRHRAAGAVGGAGAGNCIVNEATTVQLTENLRPQKLGSGLIISVIPAQPSFGVGARAR